MISVIIPVYNAEKYLAGCLDSIIKQTYRNLQIICVDDGSTDNSLRILEEYRLRDNRICILTQKNSGVSAARNRGIDVALGDYITFVDSDDTISKDMYQVLLSIIEKNNVDIAHCGYRRYNLDGSIVDVTGTEKLIIQTSFEAVRCLITGEMFSGSLCNKLYRKELFQEIRLDSAIKINEDVLANVQLFLLARKTAYYDIPAYHYYNRPQSSTSDTDRILSAKNCVVVAERIQELTRGTALEEYAMTRIRYALIEEYRALLLSRTRDKNIKLSELKNRIEKELLQVKDISRKQKLNFQLMKSMPMFYKIFYRFYNQIRKPNWDVN